MKQKTEISIQSIWQKGNEICRIYSSGLYGGRVSTFRFSGYNPFPCYSMESTFTVINQWMKENGWTKKPGGFRVTTTTFCNDDKEIIKVYETKETYIPVLEGGMR